MARLARVIVQGIPHHVTQRGNRRQKTFFSEEDYQEYISLMGNWCRKNGNLGTPYLIMDILKKKWFGVWPE
jgi:putative transposase